jgi:hypothetical protein
VVDGKQPSGKTKVLYDTAVQKLLGEVGLSPGLLDAANKSEWHNMTIPEARAAQARAASGVAANQVAAKRPSAVTKGAASSTSRAAASGASVTRRQLEHAKVLGKTSTATKLTLEVVRETNDGKLKSAFLVFGNFVEWNGRRRSSQVPVKELTPQNYFIDGKSWFNLRMPKEYSIFFADMDNAVASFLFDAPIDPTRQPKIAEVLNTLKQRSKSLEDFRYKLYKLNGASTCLDNDILPTQFQLIGKPVSAGVHFPPAFTRVNPAMAYAQEHSLEFLTSKGQALHSDGSITPITAENSVAYTKIVGLDEHRGIFAVVAFEGVFKFNYKGNLLFRVVPHLLRYTLLDVDTTLPSAHFTPSKDCIGRPVDDYDD